MSWQVQEAKQRFSEVLRAVESDGPQAITRHGEEVAVVIDIAEYRRLTGGNHDFAAHLMAFPRIETRPGDADVFDEIAAERERDQHRPTDFEVELGLVDERTTPGGRQ